MTVTGQWLKLRENEMIWAAFPPAWTDCLAIANQSLSEEADSHRVPLGRQRAQTQISEVLTMLFL